MSIIVLIIISECLFWGLLLLQNVLRETAWRLADEVIQCSFLRNVHIPSPNQDRFDLDQMYYLFMAHGRAENGKPQLVFSLQHNSHPKTVCGTWVIFHCVCLMILLSSVHGRKNA